MPVKTIFKNLCYNADKVCFDKTVSPVPVFVQIQGYHHPGHVTTIGEYKTRLELKLWSVEHSQ